MSGSADVPKGPPRKQLYQYFAAGFVAGVIVGAAVATAAHTNSGDSTPAQQETPAPAPSQGKG